MVSVRFVNSEADYIEASIACSYGSRRAGFDLIIEILALLTEPDRIEFDMLIDKNIKKRL